MKRITIKKLELKNFKNHSSLTVDFPSSGLGSIVISGHNGSGKSSILEAVIFALGGSVEAGKVLNQSTKAPASVSLTIEHPDGMDTYTRTLIPNLDASGKITASTSSYVISGVPKKKTEYDICVNQLFGTKDWIYLLNPSLAAQNKSNRNLLLAVAGCPTEKEFLQEHNPELAAKIGNTSFDDFEKREKQTIQTLGKKIDAIPGRIEENAAMLQNVPEFEDEAPIHQRIAEIREVLKGIDAENATRADAFNKISNEAQSLRNEAQKLRSMAAQKVSEANKAVNKQIEEAEKICFEWRQTLNGLLREQDQIKAEMSEARTDLARAEARAQELYAEAHKHAEAHKQTSLRPIDSEKLGQCAVCNKWCGDLAARGAEAAEKQRTNELARIVEAGKQVMSLRGKELAKINEITDRIDSLMSKEHEVEARINALGIAPTAPERKVITETPESLHLIGQAQDLEKTAEKLIKSNKLDIAQKNPQLLEELQALNEKLTRGAAARQTQKNNDKIQQRISELREEESALITTQLQHKQHIAQLKEFYKQYADSVTASVNKLFEGTGYEIRLFDTNMGNDKGVPVMQPMKEGSTNLSTAENLIFNLRYIERVLMKHYRIQCPVLADNAECVSDWGKLVGKHQSIIASVDHRKLTIWPFSVPEAQSQSK